MKTQMVVNSCISCNKKISTYVTRVGNNKPVFKKEKKAYCSPKCRDSDIGPRSICLTKV